MKYIIYTFQEEKKSLHFINMKTEEGEGERIRLSWVKIRMQWSKSGQHRKSQGDRFLRQCHQLQERKVEQFLCTAIWKMRALKILISIWFLRKQLNENRPLMIMFYLPENHVPDYFGYCSIML
jgi:hypothetical protein